MSILSKHKFIVIALYMACSILIESITFLFNSYGLLPKYFMFFIAGLLLLSSFLVLFNKSHKMIALASIFLFFQILISFANVNLLKITGEVFSWDMLTILHEAARAAGKGISVTFLYLLSVFPIMIGFMYLTIRWIKEWKVEVTIITPQIKIASTMIMMLIAAFSALLFESQANIIHNGVTHNPVTIINDSYLINTFYVKQEAYKKMGTMGYYVLSGMRSISNRLQGNYIDAMLEKLNHYFEDQSSNGETNDFTGISTDNNLIVILMETWDYSGIHPDFTPNLYALLKDSLLLSEYYSKDQTNISEAKTIFGSYPLTGILNYNYDKNVYPFTLPNMFKSAYPTSDVISFHNNDGKYYDRNRANIQFGFDAHVGASLMQLSINDLWINLDSEMFASALSSQLGLTPKLIIPEDTSQPFFSYVTTFASHGPFVYRSEFLEQYEYINNYDKEVITYLGDTLDLNDQYVQTYLAALMDLDKGIGYMIDELEERDLLATTTIALISDHYAYYHNYAHTTKSLPTNSEANPLIYKVPALIYDQKMMQFIQDNSSLLQEYHITQDQYLDISFYTCDKFFTNTDLVPTLLNMYGIPYNQAHYIGNDLFSSNQSLVLSRWGGVFDNEFYSIDGISVENLPFQYDESMIDIAETEWLSSIDEINEMIALHEKVVAFRMKASEFFIKYEYIDMMYLSNYFYHLDTDSQHS